MFYCKGNPGYNRAWEKINVVMGMNASMAETMALRPYCGHGASAERERIGFRRRGAELMVAGAGDIGEKIERYTDGISINSC